MKHLLPPSTPPAGRLGLGAVGLVLLTLPVAGQSDVKVALPPPLQVDPDLKTEHWVAPLKDGAAPSDVAHLSVAQRRAYDDAWNTVRDGRRSPLAAAGEKGAPPVAAGRMRSGVDPRGFHQLDVDPEGRLWAYGGSYKASFGPEGATFVPFLGADAPRNYPVRFQLVEASAAGAPFAVDLAATPRFEGASAVYDRGGLVERYDTRVGAVEQLFLFDRLDTRGELVVRIAVATELAGAAGPDGLAWSNERGAVTYSSAVAIDAAGRRVAAPTVLEGGAVELRVPAEFVASARLPLVIDPLIVTYAPNTSTSTDLNPDISWDRTNNRFGIVWEREFSASDHDVWAEMFDSIGNPIPSSGQYIDFTGDNWIRPKVANNRIAGQFLVVAVETNAATTEVWGRTREAEDLTQSAQFRISSGSGHKNFPDVGGDPHPSPPTYYCVTWEREFSVGVDHDVHAQLVNPNASLQGSLVLVDNSGGTYDKYPNVSKSDGVEPAGSQVWNIVWNRQFSPSDWDIRGAQLDWSGAVVQPSFSLDFSGAHDLLPKASTPLEPTGGPRAYLATYQRLDAGNWDIYATALRGATVVSRANLSHLWVSGSGTDEEYPVCDSNGVHFAVAYQRAFNTQGDYDVYVAGVYLTGTTFHVSEGPLNLAFSTSFEGYPEMASRYGAGTVSDFCGVVWSDVFGNGNIEGATYELPDHVGQVGDFYCSSATNSTGRNGILTVSGAGVRALNDLHLEAWQLPTNATVFFLTSLTQGNVLFPGGSQGVLCLGGNIGRYVGPGQVLNTGSSGAASLQVDLGQHPTPMGLVSVSAGQTWSFQAWHRDVGSASNFTNAASVRFF